MAAGKGDEQESALDRLKRFLEAKPTPEALKAWMKRLTPQEHVECALHMVQISPTTFVRVLNPELGFKNPDRLNDDELFAQLAKTVDDTSEIRNGKICPADPRANPEPWSRFSSLFNEAVRRGFKREEIYLGMRPFSEQSSKLKPSIPHDRQWERFEKLVARIHIAFCREAEVRWSEKITDRSGRPRQIDVTIRQNIGPHSVLAVVECKHQTRPVTTDEVESFITKKSDLKANLAIMVSGSGYQEGARQKAQLHDIRLWTLEEAEKISWRQELRTVQLFYPMFGSIEIHPPIPADAFLGGKGLVLDESFVVYQSKRKSIAALAALAMHQAAERCLPIPCVLDFPFAEGTRIEWGQNGYPVQRISFEFTHRVTVEQDKPIRVPTGAAYRFSSIEGTPSFTIYETDLPELEEP